jgi:hypothetical protein
MGIIILIVIWGWLTSWRRLPYYLEYGNITLPTAILSDAEYGELMDSHPRPYVVEIESGAGSLVLFGATHTKDPEDPQLTDIAERWERMRPTVALVESRLGILFPQLMDPVRTFSEPGRVHQLARQDDIPTFTWEPTPEKTMEAMFALPFTKEQIALRMKLGPYFSNRRFGRPEDPKSFLDDYLGDDTRWPGLESTLPTVGELDAAWRTFFPDGPDWRDVSDEQELPGFLKHISANAARDEHFARVIIDLVEKGERVFAVAGSSHAVKLDVALRDYFGAAGD